MIDLHTHSFLSDGELIPSELARRAQVAGYKVIAITDHVDTSNVDSVVKSIVKVSRELNKYWKIRVIPGVEITHAPLELFSNLAKRARKLGAKIVVAHGESPVEPVIPGTNRVAILAGVDILAHPGYITEEDAILAAKKGVYLEITARRGHSTTNKHVFDMSQKTGASLVLNTDTHSPEDLFTLEKRQVILNSLTAREDIKATILCNSEKLIKNLKKVDNKSNKR